MDEVCLYTYSKRRRLTRSLKCFNFDVESPVYKEPVKIFVLPSDVIHFIFHWLPCSFLVSNVKIVSKYFQENVDEYLYRKFVNMSPRLSKIYKISADAFDVIRDPPLYKKSFFTLTHIETIIHEYKMLESSVLRYLLQRRSEFVFCHCFARILDVFDYIYFRLYNKKGEFTPMSRNKKALKKFVKITRSFICHFERRTEVNFNANCFVSGAKICDILDSCVFSYKEILNEKFENGICNLKLRYNLPNAWFTVIPTFTPKPERKSWQEQQRLMYLRLRRLCNSHTAQQMHVHHWKQAQQLVALGIMDMPKIANYVYNGYGEYEDELFFYGNFNYGGFAYKMRKMELKNPRRDELIPYNLQINVELMCPVEQAPLFIYKKYCLHIDQKPDRIILKRRSPRLKNSFNMKIEFSSVPPFQYFMPSKYLFEVSEEKRLEIVERQANDA